jgi:hypothetical protein
MEGKMILGVIMLSIFGLFLVAGLIIIILGFMRATGASWKEISIIWGVSIFIVVWVIVASILIESGA